MGVSWTICPGWPWTVILLISASQVTRTAGVSCWCPPEKKLLFHFNCWCADCFPHQRWQTRLYHLPNCH
jgi:hypothetical protein